MSSDNTIYIVAGERLMRTAGNLGGLYANVGQTSRTPEERLTDDDYRRKAAGGKWQVLFRYPVGGFLTDKQIHPLLKGHPDVRWDPDSHNTEEFFFVGDPGDGSVAAGILMEILRQNHAPLLQEEVRSLRGALEAAQQMTRSQRLQIRTLHETRTHTDLMRELEAAREALHGIAQSGRAAWSAAQIDGAWEALRMTIQHVEPLQARLTDILARRFQKPGIRELGAESLKVLAWSLGAASLLGCILGAVIF